MGVPNVAECFCFAPREPAVFYERFIFFPEEFWRSLARVFSRGLDSLPDGLGGFCEKRLAHHGAGEKVCEAIECSVGKFNRVDGADIFG